MPEQLLGLKHHRLRPQQFIKFLSFSGLGLEYGDVPCAGTITGIGKVHGVDVMVRHGTAFLIQVAHARKLATTKHLRAPIFYPELCLF